MNERVKKLLQPISAEKPCGADLSDDPRFDELQTILKGTPEIEFGSVQKPAEPPDWRLLTEKSEAFLRHSKDLRAAAMLSCGLLKTEGLSGFRDGLQLIAGLVEQYWPTVYPPLDASDDNDPTQRLNILSSLTVARGSMRGGWLTFVDYLYLTHIVQPRGAAPVVFEALLAGDSSETAGKAATAIHAASVNKIPEQCQALGEALDAVKLMDQGLTTVLGSRATISFEVLQNTLQAMSKALAPFLQAASAPDKSVVTPVSVEAPPAIGETAAVANDPAETIRGPIKSRSDVVRQLDDICSYYELMEPSSPVPFLLRRARSIVNMNFLQAVQELNFTTLDSLRPMMGSAVDTVAAVAVPAAEGSPTEQS